LDMFETAKRLEEATSKVLDQGLRTADIYAPGSQQIGTAEMGDAVVKTLSDQSWQ